MIVDDDEDDRFFFKEVITKMFHLAVCIEAYDGADALSLLQKAEQLPNYIFLDINMPRLNGRECLKQLKKDASLKYIPVIMFSTSFSEKSIHEFHMLGASGYLIKPTDINKLPAQIMEAIKAL